MTGVHLDELTNEQLEAHTFAATFSTEEYMAEQERCQEVIDLNAMSGRNLDHWFDRVRIIEALRRQYT